MDKYPPGDRRQAMGVENPDPLSAGAAMHRFPICVYYEDTDLAGIVYYANYLKFIERARSEWLQGAGRGPVTHEGRWPCFRRAPGRGRLPVAARFDDLLEVETGLHASARRGSFWTSGYCGARRRCLPRASPWSTSATAGGRRGFRPRSPCGCKGAISRRIDAELTLSGFVAAGLLLTAPQKPPGRRPQRTDQTSWNNSPPPAPVDFSLIALFSRASLTVQIVAIMLILASFWAWSIIIRNSSPMRRPGAKPTVSTAPSGRASPGRPLRPHRRNPSGPSERIFSAG